MLTSSLSDRLRQTLREGRAQHANLGDQAGQVAVRRHVEGGVARPVMRGNQLAAIGRAHFGQVALLNRHLVAAGHSQVYRRDLEDGVAHGYELDSNTYWDVPLGDKRKLIWKIKDWAIFDLRVWNIFWTKYVNAFMFFQILLSIKWFIPIPYFVFCFRFSKERYFQFGFGYSPQFHLGSLDVYDTVLTAKFRIADHKSESAWNPSDVYGYWEGTI